MVDRKDYLEQLKQWRDEKVIKVVSGIRRCGKSTLLEQYAQWLQDSGVQAEQIVYLNLEYLEYEELLKTNAKYYIADLGLRNYLIARSNSDLGYGYASLLIVLQFGIIR